MGKDENTARRGRGRPRKQTLREVCDAPVIELTSSSDEDEPPPKPPVKKLPIKSSTSKPPILAKRSSTLKPVSKPPQQKPASKPPPPVQVNRSILNDKERLKKLADTEALLSILESNDEDELEGLPAIKDSIKVLDRGSEKLSEKFKDNLLKSIEEELRFLEEVDDRLPSLARSSEQTQAAKKDIAVKKIGSAKRDSVEIVEEIKNASSKHRKSETPSEPGKLVGESKRSDTSGSLLKSSTPLGSQIVIRRVKSDKKVSFGPPVTSKEDLKRKTSIDVKSKTDDSKSTHERTKVLSPSEVKLPPEVMEAIKKRANLGRIEKIVEKTDSNHKSKYIVIFNRGSVTTQKKKGTIEDEIEELLKSLPAKPPSPKKPRVDVPKEIISQNKSLPKVSSKMAPKIVTPATPSKTTAKSISSPVVKPAVEKKVVTFKSPEKSAAVLAPAIGSPPPPIEDLPVRFTESPLDDEPPLPWDTKKEDGFEKYFKITERLLEHHDSLDSDSEADEPEMFSHFKNLDAGLGCNDQISVGNIGETVSREFPGWNVEQFPGTDTICLVRLGLDHRGVMTIRKQIKVDSDYNVSVVVNNSTIPEYEGMYDSFDNIKQLVREIDQL